MELRFFRVSSFSMFIIFLFSAPQIVEGYTEYRCTEENYNQECYLRNVNMLDISTNVRFSSYYTSYKSIVRFKNSHMVEIPKAVFETFNHMLNLDVFDCAIDSVSRFTFEKASRLVELNMSSNLIEQLGNYVFTGASQMKVLDLSNNQISNIEEKAFVNLKALQTLLLSGNMLKAFESLIFSTLTNLVKLSVARNELEVIQKDLFENNTLLTMILLQTNKLILIDKDVFQNIDALEYLWLRDNNLTNFEFSNLKAKRINIANNKIHRLELNDKMEALFAANNSISDLIVHNDTIHKMKTLDLSRNNLTSMTGISELNALEVLDLSFNKIGSLEISSFSKLTALIDLNLESTKISNLQHGTFSHQTALQRLDISYNNLNRIDLDIFTSSSEMEELFIDGNRLKEIDFQEIPKMFKKLKSLSIADNHWNCSFLIKMIRYLNVMPITIGGFKTNEIISDKTNVKGIYCVDDKHPLVNWNTTVKHLDKYMNDSVTIVDAAELKEVLKQAIDDIGNFNEDKMVLLNKTNSLESEINDLKLKISQMENEMVNVKHSILEVKLAQLVNVTNQTNHVSGDLRIMMQEMNNLTLEKLNLVKESLDVKILSQTLKSDTWIEKVKDNANNIVSVSKRLEQMQQGSTNWYNHGPAAVQQQQLKSLPDTNTSSGHAYEILIIVLLAVLMILMSVGLFLVYRSKRIGQHQVTRYGNSSTLVSMMDNEI
ncbi:protein artichoke-like [Uranotaenia lowii]|uniref:protein artichoke-like n=1 Tax=Uranotaenia lowii TaxID=190385 RepID=UPI002479A9C8|nr:protein artichoke-like [Uranotaenia lowii]